ncbi:hypothetical protein CKO15_02990 [Halorhodospira abdelmalekii]|nr:hypothetical protein [Halorhodospira abdelmalekii]
MLMQAVERLLLTVWAGALWIVGFLVTPLLYRYTDETAVAAALAGELTQAVAWTSLLCAAVLIPAQLRYRIRPLAAHWRLWLLVILVVLVAVGEWWVRPPMVELTQQAVDVAYLSALRAAESLYLIACAIALVLVLGGLQPGRETLAQFASAPDTDSDSERSR